MDAKQPGKSNLVWKHLMPAVDLGRSQHSNVLELYATPELWALSQLFGFAWRDAQHYQHQFSGVQILLDSVHPNNNFPACGVFIKYYLPALRCANT